MDADALDPVLLERLRGLGLDHASLGDPGEAWRRLRERYGQRVTLIDRYALEAARRGVSPEELEPGLRQELAREVLAVQYPGLEFLPAATREVLEPIEVVPFRAEWPTSFLAWRGRLLRALGGTAVRIEHVGSTAVPGLAAKPVVDVQLSLPDVEDEDAYVPAIERLDVALRLREPGHRYFRPSGGRPRSVQIHACSAGSQWERDHLLFRDYLRAHPTAQKEYERLKLDVAARYRDDRLAYTEAKTGFVLDTLERAQDWAERSGWSLPPALGKGG